MRGGPVRSIAAEIGARPGPILAALAVTAAATLAASLLPIFARAWLILFAVLGAAPVGATVLLMIATLTGGRWGEAWRPILGPLAAASVAVALGFLPVAANLAAIYPWRVDPGALPADVARWYLNGPAFLLRAGIALAGWSVLGWLFGLGRPSRLAAGLGLAFHGIAISLVAVDWFLSVEPGYASSDFAATVAIQQIATALAIVALVGQDGPVAKARGDVGSLLIATQVGIGYLGLMAFIIAWYGDLPETVRWYVQRGQDGWLALILAAVAIGCLLPFGILMRRGWRSGAAPRLAGGAALTGIALHDVWWIGPPLGSLPALWAGGLLALAGVVAAGWWSAGRRRGGALHAG